MPQKKLLIIEDDRQVALALSIRLQGAGYDLDLAYDGESALEKLREGDYVLALLDIRLPGMDGLEVIARMKQDAKLAGIPVIFVSANAQERVKRART